MNNGSLYFPHDYAATTDPKIQALIGEHGASGYGIYWRIVEMLHSDVRHILPLKKYIYIAIAKQMLANAEKIEAMVNECINTYDLLVSDGENFWSERVLRNIEARAQISKKRAVAGKRGAEERYKKAIAKQTLANAKQTLANKRKVNIDNVNTSLPGNTKSWKEDYQIYLSELRTAYETIVADRAWMDQQERLNPRIDVQKSIEKACVNFWASEEGWRHKKKEKVETINWKTTFGNTITLNGNKVFRERAGND